MAKLLLIDGNSILNRAYFALPPLNDKSGRNVNAVFGFMNILIKVVQDVAADKLVVAFDMRGHNFRKDIYPEYKANRKGMPDDLAEQMPILHDLLAKMRVTVVEKAGVEADDIIGTVTNGNGMQNFVVSGDRDMLQLVSPSVTVLLTKRGVTEVENVTPESLKANYNLTPEQVIEYKALRGDTSDNIPGVRGIGEKTATALLEKYGNIDSLFENIDKEKGALHDKLVEGKDMAYISKRLATIVRNADVEYDLEKCGLYVLNDEVQETLENLQFRSIISRLKFDKSVKKEVRPKVETLQITDLEQLKNAVDEIVSSKNVVAFHFCEGKIYLANSAEKQFEITMSDSFLDELTEQTVFDSINPILCGDVTKVVYDLKALRHALKAHGAELSGVSFDVCLMQYLVEYRAHKDLENLVSAYGYEEIGAGIFAAYQTLQKQLAECNLEKLYYDVELPLSDLLFRMEEEGVSVDENLLKDMSLDLHRQLEILTREIHECAGETFNVNSPMQLSAVLFEKLGLPHGKKNHRGYSTSNDVLENLSERHPIVNKILEFRKISKLLSTYVDGMKPFIKRGVVHTTFNQALTSTGRLSSSDPNLQNIPIRNDRGKEIRKLFCSKNGTFVGADYSQIELRLLAAFSGDENLLSSFRENVDIHAKVASEIMGIPVEMVNKDMRRMAKAVNFGIIYGISDFGLSQNAGISVKKAHEYIRLYFERFPKIKTYLDGCVTEAKNKGYVSTITGRRRQIPEIKSSNFNLRAFGERAAMNMPLQGSAADIMKMAMLNVDKALQKAGLKSKLVLQIHDEIIVDCFEEEAEQVKQIVKFQMEHTVDLPCPLTAETEEGRTLYEA
ncbi:MAG: DNA polymerase I [Corallococcus sp.]|nr:DNA polymerase I [Corallococcus sp.]MCM1359251.1 DNA polymerase I [Corallococcus sp.]MCM1394642.1 DNA polymerase I [Corallococcus sp.]